MGKPRMIIVIRHAQSEGNKNREIHQKIPDHRVKLTPDGWTQAEEAGRRLRSMLRPDDTLQFYTSPYRRARETTEGILNSLTSDDPTPSPFRRNAIKVWEEPRLREQDFGNFQPCSAEMERMWKERAEYGHFFYRIPNGESAADAYDRVSGFNESLWRSFGEDDFASVCVLVTHGLMTRVFLMKWYHWSVEYFEDLRNVNHCEFVLMTRSDDGGGKFLLQNQLRTWSELRRQRAAERKEQEQEQDAKAKVSSPIPVRTRWGACPDGCTDTRHGHPPSTKTQDPPPVSPLPPAAAATSPPLSPSSPPPALPPKAESRPHPTPRSKTDDEQEEEAFPKPSRRPAPLDLLNSKPSSDAAATAPLAKARPWLTDGRDGGGSESGAPSPTDEMFGEGVAGAEAESVQQAQRRQQALVEQSGMASGARADALGDQGGEEDVEAAEAEDKSVRGSVY